MIFNTTVGLLILLLFDCALSGCWKYGDCNPGPNCENYEDNHCLKCNDGGFIPNILVGDGRKDCKNGFDEVYDYSFDYGFQNWHIKNWYGGFVCKPENIICGKGPHGWNHECCSGKCKCDSWINDKCVLNRCA